jgi:YD repeat-containing protein
MDACSVRSPEANVELHLRLQHVCAWCSSLDEGMMRLFAQSLTPKWCSIVWIVASLCFSPARAQETVAYEYDDLGRLVRVDYGAGVERQFDYDDAGNRKQVLTFGVGGAFLATDDAASVDEDASVLIDPISNDNQGGGVGLQIVAVGSPGSGAAVIQNNGTRILYTPNADFSGADSFLYTVSDGLGTASATINVTVNPFNDAPDAINDSTSTNEDTAKTYDPRSNDLDPDGDALTIIGNTNGSKGSVAIINNGAQIRYTPNANVNGSDSFTYTISDGVLTDTATVTITITAVNDAPNAVNDSVSTNEDTAITISPLANDTDLEGTPLTITAKTNSSKASVTIVNGGTQINYSPNANVNGSDSFTYTISDGALTDTATVSVTINAVNDPPSAVNDTYSNVDKTVWTTFSVLNNDTDPEGDALTITAASAVNGGAVQIISSGTQLRYICSSCSTSEDFVSYTISDGNGGTSSATVSIFLTGGGGGGPPLF